MSNTPPPTPSTRTDLAPWQVEVGGLVLGPGTPLPIGEIAGLGAPALRPQDVDNPTGDGTLLGADYFGPRTVRIEAAIKTPGDPAAGARLFAALNRAVAAPQPRMTPGARSVLRVRWPGHHTRRLYGRLRRAEATSMAQAVHGWIPLDIEFIASDPFLHDDTASHLSLTLDAGRRSDGVPTPLSGLGDCGVVDVDARPGWISNDGDAPAWPSLRIRGPVAGPRLWNTVTGQALELAVTLRAGETVDIDTRPGARWVLRNEEANAAAALTPDSRLDLFTVPPGRSEIGWTGVDPTDTCRLEVSWRSAYTGV